MQHLYPNCTESMNPSILTSHVSTLSIQLLLQFPSCLFLLCCRYSFTNSLSPEVLPITVFYSSFYHHPVASLCPTILAYFIYNFLVLSHFLSFISTYFFLNICYILIAVNISVLFPSLIQHIFCFSQAVLVIISYSSGS